MDKSYESVWAKQELLAARPGVSAPAVWFGIELAHSRAAGALLLDQSHIEFGDGQAVGDEVWGRLPGAPLPNANPVMTLHEPQAGCRQRMNVALGTNLAVAGSVGVPANKAKDPKMVKRTAGQPAS
jgi:hypothetical protein